MICKIFNNIPFKKPVFENVTENYKFYYYFLIPVPVFLGDFQSVMDYERIKGRRKSSSIFCCNGYMHSKKDNYKPKINFRRVLSKKVCSGTAYTEFRNL